MLNQHFIYKLMQQNKLTLTATFKFKQSTREQSAKEPWIRDHSVDSGSTLANFAKRHFGVELSYDFSSDVNDDGEFSSTRVFHDAPFDKWVKQGKPTRFPFSLINMLERFYPKTIVKKKNEWV